MSLETRIDHARRHARLAWRTGEELPSRASSHVIGLNACGVDFSVEGPAHLSARPSAGHRSLGSGWCPLQAPRRSARRSSKRRYRCQSGYCEPSVRLRPYAHGLRRRRDHQGRTEKGSRIQSRSSGDCCSIGTCGRIPAWTKEIVADLKSHFEAAQKG